MPEELDPKKLHIMDDVLVYETGDCNCAASAIMTSVHENYCGLEYVASVQEVLNALKASKIVREEPWPPRQHKRDYVMRLVKQSPDGGFREWCSVELDIPEVDKSFENEVRLC